MKIAVPLSDGMLSSHFGQSTHVAILDADEQSHQVTDEQVLAMPPHAPGALPRFIAQHDPYVVITGGIGERAVIMLADAGIRVLHGAAPMPARDAALAYLDGSLVLGQTACHHGPDHVCEHDHHDDHHHHHHG